MLFADLPAIGHFDTLRGSGDLASVLAHIIKTLAGAGDAVGEPLAKPVRIIEVGAEVSVAAVMPIGEDLHIEPSSLVICERILLDLGNLELGFHAIMFHDVLLSGITERFLGIERLGTHLGVSHMSWMNTFSSPSR